MNTQTSNKWTFSTRSEVRRTTKHHQLRKVDYVRRLLLFCSLILFPVLIWLSVYLRLIDVNDSLAFIYRLHDDIYLWFKGHTWTAIFPYSFIWLFPLSFSFAMLLLEYLTPLKISKAVQRSITVALLKYETGRKLLKIGLNPSEHLSVTEWKKELNTGVEEVKRGVGFLRRVLIELLTKNQIVILNAVEENKKFLRKRIRFFFELADFRIFLRAFGPVTLFGILECAVVNMIHNNEGLSLRSIFQKLIALLDAGGSMNEVQTDLTIIKNCFIHLQEDTLKQRTEAARIVEETNRWLITGEKVSSCELTTNFLRATRLVLAHKLPEGRDLLESWLLCRLGVNSNEVAKAERLMHFSFWAVQIEKVASDYKLSGLSAQLWPNSSRLIETGEEFAWHGSVQHV